ncbi:putative necrosis-inducing factor-domain-containing protein [Podospora fimiseda]|uniref:Necrosis-inducing factor-domain-containing protein n=1 Tax=Podospora fimiseda TaxID=252190 RepID=A0AAN6YQ81_9PEZI|nr:putative necrosis-inducing factor-domain-containing protein [Podospora fimiseda]
MLFANILAFATAVTAAAVSKTATSPDGYVYDVVDESLYVADTITLPDGNTTTVLIHPSLKFKRGVDTSDKLDKRLGWSSGSPDRCGASSFINKSSGGSPVTGDCEAIRNHYQHANGYFTAASWDLGSHWTRLVITGSCVFGIKSGNQGGIHVGSTDIYDLTRDAINMYRTNWNPSRIGAEGHMGCNVMIGGTAAVDWAIFHN